MLEKLQIFLGINKGEIFLSKSALDYFGEIIIKRVRDEAIDDLERIISGKMKGTVNERIYARTSTFSPNDLEFIEDLLRRAVDRTLHHLLWTFEQEENLNIAINSETETVESVRDISDGLAGELYTEDGWIARFSKKPPTL